MLWYLVAAEQNTALHCKRMLGKATVHTGAQFLLRLCQYPAPLRLFGLKKRGHSTLRTLITCYPLPACEQMHTWAPVASYTPLSNTSSPRFTFCIAPCNPGLQYLMLAACKENIYRGLSFSLGCSVFWTFSLHFSSHPTRRTVFLVLHSTCLRFSHG